MVFPISLSFPSWLPIIIKEIIVKDVVLYMTLTDSLTVVLISLSLFFLMQLLSPDAFLLYSQTTATRVGVA